MLRKKHGAIKPDYDLNALVDDFDYCINCGDLMLNERKYQGGLRKWFKQKWVNIAKKKKGGGHPECGTSGSKKRLCKMCASIKGTFNEQKTKEVRSNKKKNCTAKSRQRWQRHRRNW